MQGSRARNRLVIGWIIVIGVWAARIPLDDAVERMRLVRGYNQPTPITKMTEFSPTAVTSVAAGAMMGSFRGVAANFLWLEMTRLWDEGKGVSSDAEDVMRTVTLLDPHWLHVWIFSGWHNAYNMSYEFEAQGDKLRDAGDVQGALVKYGQQGEYIHRGTNYLREGVGWNPGRYELYFELAWTYFDKWKDYQEAAKWQEAALRFPHPEYLDRQIAHAAERVPDMQMALDWYDFCLRRNPADGTAIGATITIRERYLRAWRLMEAGQYNQALSAAEEYLLVNPNDRLPLTLKAVILERAGRYAEALQVWKLAATIPLNWAAERKVIELSRRLGQPIPLGCLDEQGRNYPAIQEADRRAWGVD